MMGRWKIVRRKSRAGRSAGGGFVFLDAVTALAIIAAMTVLMVVALGRQRQAARQLADTREATRLAETTLQRLREAGPATTFPNVPGDETPGVKVSVTPLRVTAKAPIEWAQVSVVWRSGHATLVGPVGPFIYPQGGTQ